MTPIISGYTKKIVNGIQKTYRNMDILDTHR